jgi:serine/threonine-protein kinase
MAPTPSLRGTTGAVLDRMVGRTLGGRYRVLSRLGEGGMGTVYLCEHAVLGRRYAVKVLRAELCSDPELGERFRNEAIAASRIGGDNVVDVLDFGESDGALYYVMEALDGRSLGAILAEQGPLEVPRTLDLLDQICRALAAAHARGVIHRDVKPDNIFVVRRHDGSEQAKVIDFGISQVAPPVGKDRITIAGSIIGTPEYMAPEQAAGEPIDERADVYALGVLAYELLTGTLPIVALTPVATLVAHQTLAPVAPSRRRAGIPPEVDALVLRALAKRPADRPRSMEAFSAAIAAIRRPAGAGGPPRADSPPPSPSPRAARRPETVALPESRPFTRRRWRTGRVVVIMGVVGGIALAAGAVWWSGRGVTGRAGAVPGPGPAAVPVPAAAPASAPAPAASESGRASSTSTSTSTTTTTATSTSTAKTTSKATSKAKAKARLESESATEAAAKSGPAVEAPAAAKPGRRTGRAGGAPQPAEPDGVGALKDPYR